MNLGKNTTANHHLILSGQENKDFRFWTTKARLYHIESFLYSRDATTREIEKALVYEAITIYIIYNRRYFYKGMELLDVIYSKIGIQINSCIEQSNHN